MAANDASPKGVRAQWAVASPGRKAAMVLMIAATVAIIVFVIIPLMKSAFVAGEAAVR